MRVVSNKSRVLFQADEMRLYLLQEFKHHTKEEILALEGMFYLKDLVKAFSLNRFHLQQILKRFESDPEARYNQIGVGQLWGNWVVRMRVFAPFFRSNHLVQEVEVSKIPQGWDANRLMQAKGVFRLVQVCRLLPFSARSFRYRCRMDHWTRETHGIWKDEQSLGYLVDMEVFARWVQELWQSPEENRGHEVHGAGKHERGSEHGETGSAHEI